jgi:putative endonuclease
LENRRKPDILAIADAITIVSPNLPKITVKPQMNTGKQGEEVVAEWLTNRGGKVLHHRWRWKRGEIDLIAIEADMLLFIEVKTRNRANWDADGLLAITPQKQAKIVRSAELFLLKYPHLSEYPCRFDVAIVRHQPIAEGRSSTNDRAVMGIPLQIVTDLTTDERWLLLDYITSAFDGV